MDSKYFYDMCILMFKILNGLLPDWLISLPSIAQVREESICTRQRNNLFIPRTFTETGAKAFNVRGPAAWNTLPMIIRNANSILSFKHNLKRYLLEE